MDDGGHVPAGPGTTVSEMADGDAPAVVALWRACDLTRPWNDPATDLASALATESSTVLVARLPEPGTQVAGTVMADFYAALGYTDQECVVLGRRFE